MTSIGILGMNGRMGQALIAACHAQNIDLSGGTTRDAPDAIRLAKQSTVLIDFTAPQALQEHLDAALKGPCALVIGTTGLTQEHHAAIDEAARHIAIVQSDNMSLGVNLLAHFVRKASQALDEDWDIEVLEMHHRHKVDAPSGTALMLGRAAAEGRGVALNTVADKVRDGITGPRTRGHIGFATLRGGSVPGDHDVIFAGEDERLILAHKAGSRAIFAKGALRAALWVKDKPAGRYSMADVLGLGD